MKKRSIVHIEIPAASREKSAKFYADMFGWETEHMPPEMRYTMFKAGGVDGGFPEIGDDYKPGDVVIYIESDNLEADLKQIEAKSGKLLMKPTEIPGMGHFAFFADPAGNRIALFKGNGNQPG